MNHTRWIKHFEGNRLDRPEPAWDSLLAVPEGKRAALARSLAEYQLGDGGGHCRLIAIDAESVRGASAEMRLLIDLWFAEEREHSRLLKCAVDRLRGTLVRSTFAFRLFNGIRRLLGVQFEMLVLLIVEIVSTGYYRLIRRHCDDEPIAAMCRLILRDEAGHIAFHRDRLASRHVNGPGAAFGAAFHFLGYACAAFLWVGHGRDLRTIGATRRELFREVTAGVWAFLSSLSHVPERGESKLTPVAGASYVPKLHFILNSV